MVCLCPRLLAEQALIHGVVAGGEEGELPGDGALSPAAAGNTGEGLVEQLLIGKQRLRFQLLEVYISSGEVLQRFDRRIRKKPEEQVPIEVNGGKARQRNGDPEGNEPEAPPPGAMGLGGEAQFQRALEVQQAAVLPLVVPTEPEEDRQAEQGNPRHVQEIEGQLAGISAPDHSDPGDHNT